VNQTGFADIHHGGAQAAGRTSRCTTARREQPGTYFAYRPTSRVGNVARPADVDNDGQGRCHHRRWAVAGSVRVFRRRDADAKLYSFFGPSGRDLCGGILVAGADLDGDAGADLIVSQRQGTSAQCGTFQRAPMAHCGKPLTPFANSRPTAFAWAPPDRDGRRLKDCGRLVWA